MTKVSDHVPYRCSGGYDDCREAWCATHHGELFSCQVCGGGEGDLPTQCPGHPMTEDQRNRVSSGWIDFRNGRWYANGRTDREGKVFLPRDEHGRAVGSNQME